MYAYIYGIANLILFVIKILSHDAFVFLFQRCLDCPIAYHITCIPPCTRFHELALLCHEHYTNKLPDLDTESSFQAEVEAKADAMVEKMRETKRRKLERLKKQKEKNLDL